MRTIILFGFMLIAHTLNPSEIGIDTVEPLSLKIIVGLMCFWAMGLDVLDALKRIEELFTKRGNKK